MGIDNIEHLLETGNLFIVELQRKKLGEVFPVGMRFIIKTELKQIIDLQT